MRAALSIVRSRSLEGKHCTVSKWLETQPSNYVAAIFDGDVVAAAPKRGLAAASEKISRKKRIRSCRDA